MKQCSDCKEWLPLDKFESDGRNRRKKRCGVCHHKYRLNKEGDHIKEKWRRNRRESTYEITEAQYQALLAAQKGVCWICKHVPNSKALHIDHDHRTNKVRGLLCYRCNVALGFFKDDIDRLEDAIQYLLNPPFPRLLENAPADTVD